MTNETIHSCHLEGNEGEGETESIVNELRVKERETHCICLFNVQHEGNNDCVNRYKISNHLFPHLIS